MLTNLENRIIHVFFTNKLPENLLFFIWVSCHEHLQITGLQGKEESISVTPH